MKEIFDQDCPLCGTPAKFHLDEYDNRKHFKCSKCTSFQISIGAVEKLLKSSKEWRDDVSNRAAQAPESHTLVITLPSLPQEEETSKAFIARYVPDDDLLE